MSKRPVHHTADGFRNNYDRDPHGGWALVKFLWELQTQRWERPRFAPADSNPQWLRDNGTKPSATWIGHATFLLQLGGRNVLTDPHFSRRASPLAWAGPARLVNPGLTLDDLPDIHVVVISHDHYDHLDLPSVRRLARNHDPVFFVPLRVGDIVRGAGARRVVELDWWRSEQAGPLSVTAVPVQHFSGRGPRRNRTLWAGWVLRHGDFQVLFAGDTGYSRDFTDIAERLGPMDLSLLPIGAYEPRDFMRPMHVNPEEAVQIHLDLQSRFSIAMHWGTFRLTTEPLDEPPRRLRAALAAHGVDEDRFWILKHGETRVLPQGGS